MVRERSCSISLKAHEDGPKIPLFGGGVSFFFFVPGGVFDIPITSWPCLVDSQSTHKISVTSLQDHPSWTKQAGLPKVVVVVAVEVVAVEMNDGHSFVAGKKALRTLGAILRRLKERGPNM